MIEIWAWVCLVSGVQCWCWKLEAFNVDDRCKHSTISVVNATVNPLQSEHKNQAPTPQHHLMWNADAATCRFVSCLPESKIYTQSCTQDHGKNVLRITRKHGSCLETLAVIAVACTEQISSKHPLNGATAKLWLNEWRAGGHVEYGGFAPNAGDDTKNWCCHSRCAHNSNSKFKSWTMLQTCTPFGSGVYPAHIYQQRLS